MIQGTANWQVTARRKDADMKKTRTVKSLERGVKTIGEAFSNAPFVMTWITLQLLLATALIVMLWMVTAFMGFPVVLVVLVLAVSVGLVPFTVWVFRSMAK